MTSFKKGYGLTYQLLQSVGKDPVSNIAAKGLSGEGYEGTLLLGYGNLYISSILNDGSGNRKKFINSTIFYFG